MSPANPSPAISIWASLARVLMLKCPRCGTGHLFEGWFRMAPHCPHCHLETEPEPGFYLGSIYFNYGMTVVLTSSTYIVLVLGCGAERDDVIWPAAVFSILFPVWFFRYARTLWLSIAWRVSSMDFATRPPDARPKQARATRSSHGTR